MKVLEQFDICLRGSDDVLVEMVGPEIDGRPTSAHVTFVGEDDENPTHVVEVRHAEAVALRDLFARIAESLAAVSEGPDEGSGDGTA